MTVSDRDEVRAAWEAVHDATRPGWRVGRPSYHEEDRAWHVFARDRFGGEHHYLEAIGPTEAKALRDLSRLMAEWVEES